MAVSVGVAVAMGYRPEAGLVDALVAVALVALLALALTWLTVAFGLAAKTVESASNLPMLLVLLPFLGSGFVPTDSMPAGLRWFADHQPFTAVIDASPQPPRRDDGRLRSGRCGRLVRGLTVWVGARGSSYAAARAT